jgi:uncharacterized membrane protein YjjP (DUF1212 family)
MTERNQQLVAYLATLGALILVFIAALIAGAISPNIIGKIEAFGLGTITGGLIGVLRLPTQRNVTVDNAPSDPVPTQDAPK